MKQLSLVVVLAACLSACGSSPTAPSAPPAPVYTNLIGGWSGTSSITVQQTATGVRATNICTTQWIVTAQAGGALTGTFQLSGGTLTACAQSGNFSGSLSTTGALSLAYASTSGSSTCTFVGGDTAFSGVATASTITAQETLHLNCSGFATDQINSISLTRR